jgi:hypothetical protein
VSRSQAFHDALAHADVLRSIRLPLACALQAYIRRARDTGKQATGPRLYSGAHAPASRYAMTPMSAAAPCVARARASEVLSFVPERRSPCWIA